MNPDVREPDFTVHCDLCRTELSEDDLESNDFLVRAVDLRRGDVPDVLLMCRCCGGRHVVVNGGRHERGEDSVGADRVAFR